MGGLRFVWDEGKDIGRLRQRGSVREESSLRFLRSLPFREYRLQTSDRKRPRKDPNFLETAGQAIAYLSVAIVPLVALATAIAEFLKASAELKAEKVKGRAKIKAKRGANRKAKTKEKAVRKVIALTLEVKTEDGTKEVEFTSDKHTNPSTVGRILSSLRLPEGPQDADVRVRWKDTEG